MVVILVYNVKTLEPLNHFSTIIWFQTFNKAWLIYFDSYIDVFVK